MKTVLYLLGIVFLLSSCGSTYYYSTLDTSSLNMAKADNGDFIIENDSATVIYSFNGMDAPIYISIYNKTNKPMYVDWQRSALIIEDEATSYMGQNIPISGYTESSSIRYNRTYSDSYGSFSGMATIPKNLSFLPPNTRTSNVSLKLTNFNFNSIRDDKYIEQNMYKASMVTKDGTQTGQVKAIVFNEDDSPLRFRSYLTMYFGEEMTPMVFDESFYMSHLIKSKSITPKNIPENFAGRGDTFYVEKEGNGGTVAAILVSSALIVGAAAIDAHTNE